MYLTIEGTVEKIIYTNESNGYTVAELAAYSDELYTLVGTMPYLSAGETIQAHGGWINHPSFGRQFKVEFYDKQLPATESAMLKYLSSGAIPGVGPKTAARIIEKYGSDAFEVMEKNPEWLADIPGITAKKAKDIGESFSKQFGMRNVMMFCRDFFGPATAVKIYKKWGSASVDIIKKNPYVLCDEINGIGFERADEVAKSLGLRENSPERICSGIRYVLTYNQFQNGHVCIPREKLLATSVALLKCGERDASMALDAMLETGILIPYKIDGKQCIYTQKAFEAENFTVRKLDLLEKTSHTSDKSNSDALIQTNQLMSGIQYDTLQKKAIRDAVGNGVFLLTGGPGTGKTTVVKAIISIFESLSLRVALAAPTGRAAKRLSQASSHEAKTLHRLLEMEYGEGDELKFRRDETYLLDEDVIIVDEASMIDIFLMEALLKATKPGARLIMIGDADQLPPVGAGNVLRDILNSDRYSSVRLTHIFRQSDESLIVTNAHCVNNGEHIDLNKRGDDFFYMPRDSEELTAQTVAELCKTRLPKRYGLSVYDGIQVITPSRKGGAGTETLNRLLQASINPPTTQKREKKIMDKVFREGDKVMQVRNNYDITWTKNGKSGLGMFNGDIGIIKKISLHDESMTIDFDDRITEYDFSMLDDLELAYAITVHKSQGSEYPIVILPLYRYTPRLLTRSLLYTAMTRAQQMIILVGDGSAVIRMTDNNIQTKRYTGLEYMMKQYD